MPRKIVLGVGLICMHKWNTGMRTETYCHIMLCINCWYGISNYSCGTWLPSVPWHAKLGCCCRGSLSIGKGRVHNSVGWVGWWMGIEGLFVCLFYFFNIVNSKRLCKYSFYNALFSDEFHVQMSKTRELTVLVALYVQY